MDILTDVLMLKPLPQSLEWMLGAGAPHQVAKAARALLVAILAIGAQNALVFLTEGVSQLTWASQKVRLGFDLLVAAISIQIAYAVERLAGVFNLPHDQVTEAPAGFVGLTLVVTGLGVAIVRRNQPKKLLNPAAESGTVPHSSSPQYHPPSGAVFGWFALFFSCCL
ncbi:MAG: hypothetical protein KBA31_07095 [Alphaproteobacteria bacterium]|nr:hypothetical protein [Alphaproteobacteria bacterium]